MNPASATRRIDLDWLRILAFAVLILYHIGLLYVSWPYHAKSRHEVQSLRWLLAMVHPWRLLLLFLISGIATRFMVHGSKPGRLVRSRSVRLLIPLVFGILVVVPPQSFVQAMEQFGYRESYLPFWLKDDLIRHQICDGTHCLILPTWNHLWFVLYLYLYTVVVIAAVAAWPFGRQIWDRISQSYRSGAMMVLLPAVLLVGARAAFYLRFPPNDALFGDWYNHAVYFLMFVFGFSAASRPDIWTTIGRCRWPALIMTLCLLPSVWAIEGLSLPLGITDILSFDPFLAFPLYQWSAVIMVLGFGGRRLTRSDGPCRRYLTEAVFPFYIVHQTLIVLCIHAIRDVGLPVYEEALIVLACTAFGCIATFEVVRRVTLLRPLFGLRPVMRGLPHAG